MKPKVILKTFIIILAFAIACAWIYVAFFGQRDVSIKDGIYITDNFLFEDVASPSDINIEKNIANIKKFVGNDKNVTLAIVPTAITIKQEELPSNVKPYNQRQLINTVYSELYQNVRTVDVYPILFSQRSEYIYHYTSSHLTELGGYYLYNQIAQKIGVTPREISNFEIETIDNNYYGELAKKIDVYKTKADLLNVYRYISGERHYKLTNKFGDNSSTYYELFPTYLAKTGDSSRVLFGGENDLLDIEIYSPYDTSLLIFSDDTAIASLPFLVAHYGRITVVNLNSVKASDLRDIDISSYSHILFTYSAKNFAEKDLRIDRIKK